MTDAKAAIQTCVSKEHTNEGLRKAGVKLYQWFEEISINDKDVLSGVSVEKNADMSNEDYENVKKHMENLRNPGEEKPARVHPGGSASKKAKLDKGSDATPVQKAFSLLSLQACI